MIVSRAPLRVSFCGGGSDIPGFYRKNGGCVISTSIDKYIHIVLSESFYKERNILKYSKTEMVTDNSDIEHPVFKECLSSRDLHGLDLASFSDIPAGTGLGSSSTFTVALLNALETYSDNKVNKEFLADQACKVEIDYLKEPIGKQDQYAAAYGGFNFIRFNTDDSVDVEPVKISTQDKEYISGNMMMFYMGGIRNASNILKGYGHNIQSGDAEQKQISMCKMAEELRDEIESGNIDSLGKYLDDSWKLKRALANNVTNPAIDEVYEKAMNAGADGGKLLGAGGSGFVLMYVKPEKQASVCEALKEYRRLDVKMENSGASIVLNNS